MPSVSRGGWTLVELLLALALGAVVLSGFTVLAARRMRGERMEAAVASSRSALADAARAMQEAAATAAASDLRVEGDSAVRLTALRALGVACDTAGGVLTVVWLHGATGRAPLAGDRLTLGVGDSAWRGSVERATRAMSRRPGCGARLGAFAAIGADTWPRWELAFGAAPVVVGALPAPARLDGGERWERYRAGDGWQLGWRPCDAVGGCGAVQPVAGPLAPPREGGFVAFRASDGRARVTLRSGDGVWTAVALVAGAP